MKLATILLAASSPVAIASCHSDKEENEIKRFKLVPFSLKNSIRISL